MRSSFVPRALVSPAPTDAPSAVPMCAGILAHHNWRHSRIARTGADHVSYPEDVDSARGPLEQARAAFARREFGTAYRMLTTLDQTELDPADLSLLADSAWWLGLIG